MTDLSDRPCRAGLDPFGVVVDKNFHAAGLAAAVHPALVGGDEVEGLQRALAYSAARSDIEVYCQWMNRDDAGNWFATDDVVEDELEHVHVAVRYLSAVGLLRRHASNPEWVQVLPLVEVERHLSEGAM